MKTATTVIIGIGNLGTHLARVFAQNIPGKLHLHGRKIDSVKPIAQELNASYSTDYKDLPKEAQLYIISVSDTALASLLKNTLLKNKIANALTLHTAGAAPLHILQNLSENIGVLYPLQSFSKNISLNFQTTPLCIEANNAQNIQVLKKYACRLSKTVQIINSEERLHLHLAAVFANNFSNHMLSLAEHILQKKNIDFQILHPIILNTFEKIMRKSPAEVQTGPAVRQDKITLEKHQNLLKKSPDLLKMYNFVSQDIMNFQTKKNG